MNLDEILRHEETLDPQDWHATRELGHRMVDDMMDYLQTIREQPAWRPIPQRVKDHLQQPLPLTAQGDEHTYQDFLENVLPYPHGNIHPRYWGFVNGTGSALGMLSEMLAAAMNPNCGGADHSAIYVEQQVINWCKEMLDYAPEASGVLVSGGSMANLMGLAIARNTQFEFDIRHNGVAAVPGMMTVYCSSEAHSSVQKAIELLGLGYKALRKIPVDRHYRIDLASLEKTIAADRQAGHLPFCIVGNAGTVNTGAIDALEALADICQREKLWFHIDGAFGALAALAPEMRSQLTGLQRGESLAFDLHKWMYLPYEAGCLLVKNKAAHEKAFAVVPTYLAPHDRGLMGGPPWFANYGLQLSRGFRALKIWLAFKSYGLDKFRRLIHQNILQARYLAQLVEASPELELAAPVPLNIVCFRFISSRLDETQLNQINRELMMELHERGIAVPTSTFLQGKYVLRVAITNHRSRREDFEVLVRESIRLGNELLLRL